MLHLFLIIFFTCGHPPQQEEIKIVENLLRLRNEHKADSAENLYADNVLVYMKYLRNVSKKKITQNDKIFWKSYPKYRFEITSAIQVHKVKGMTTAIVYGNEFLDGVTIKKEKLEIKFDPYKKINYFRAYIVR